MRVLFFSLICVETSETER